MFSGSRQKAALAKSDTSSIQAKVHFARRSALGAWSWHAPFIRLRRDSTARERRLSQIAFQCIPVCSQSLRRTSPRWRLHAGVTQQAARNPA